MKIKEGFRRDIESYFRSSGIREWKKLNHTPFIVIGKEIEICDNAKKLVDKFKSSDLVLGQWRGEWSSDFFWFKVGEFKEYIKNNPKESYQII